MMHILGLCGSLRKGSYNRRLLTAAANLLPDGATVEMFERLVDITPYSEEIDGGSLRAELPTPVVVQELRDAISAADAVLIVTPEYNASAQGWSANHPATFLLSVDEAFDLGRRTNRMRWGNEDGRETRADSVRRTR